MVEKTARRAERWRREPSGQSSGEKSPAGGVVEETAWRWRRELGRERWRRELGERSDRWKRLAQALSY